MRRQVEPEILDSLPAGDPEAERSRRDLRLINRLMGNHRWLRHQVAKSAPPRIVEIGAGDGALLQSLHTSGRFGMGALSGIDLAPRPPGLPASVGWESGDVFANFEPCDGVVANLFLHHFEAEKLRELGGLLRRCRSIFVCEPWRSKIAMVEGYSLFPLVNRVTRHDMIVSIRAGFVKGELPELLGLRDDSWRWIERRTAFGAYRLAAWRI